MNVARELATATVDTWTVPGHYSQPLVDWLGDRYVDYTADGLYVRTSRGETCLAHEGWVLAIWPDGGLVLMAEDAARRILAP